MDNKNIKILAVDDDPRNLRVISELFAREYTLHEANDGSTALSMLEDVEPDIVLLDIVMPEIDGLEVCRRIRANKKFSKVKIVMVSARAMPDERAAGYAAGADQYVSKPFDTGELLNIVEAMRPVAH